MCVEQRLQPRLVVQTLLLHFLLPTADLPALHPPTIQVVWLYGHQIPSTSPTGILLWLHAALLRYNYPVITNVHNVPI